MSRTYATDAAGFAAAAAIVEAKHIWIDGRVLRVFTGADIPPMPEPEPRLVPEDTVVTLLRSRGVATDEAAKTLIDSALLTRELVVEGEELVRG